MCSAVKGMRAVNPVVAGLVVCLVSDLRFGSSGSSSGSTLCRRVGDSAAQLLTVIRVECQDHSNQFNRRFVLDQSQSGDRSH